MRENESESNMLLSTGKVLNRRYRIERVLGVGGFGVTYLAAEINSSEKVAIKEFFPFNMAVRDQESGYVYSANSGTKDIFLHGVQVFKKESEILRRFAGNTSVVQVMDCFEENGTAYFSMEYLDGVNLKTLMRSMGGRVPLELGTEVLRNMAETLQNVHEQGLLHRDISPENIFITKAGQIKLIDFGATRTFIGEKSRSLSVILKPGFAPPEQYSTKGNQGPWTDIYALCATGYLAVTGITIPDAPSRLDGEIIQPLVSIFPEIGKQISDAIEQGLQLDYRKRPQSMRNFLMLTKENQIPVQINPREKKEDENGHAELDKIGKYEKSKQGLTDDDKKNECIEKKKSSSEKRRVQNQTLKNCRPFLLLEKSGELCDKWEIPEDRVMKIGRSSEQCNIVLDEPNISRVHCTIRYDAITNRFYLIDLSSNGTYRGEERLQQGCQYILQPGDKFFLIRNKISMKAGVE